MSYGLLDDEEAKAKKVLGDAAKFPDRKVDIGELGKKQKEAFEAFYKARDEMGGLLESCANTTDAVINGVKRLSVSYEKNNFGLDEKKKDDAKKIKQAQKNFSGFFKEEVATLSRIENTVDELEKHLVQLSKYKGPK